MRRRVEESWGLRFSLLIRSSLYVIFRQRLRVQQTRSFENQQDALSSATFEPDARFGFVDLCRLGLRWIACGIGIGIGIGLDGIG